MIEDFTSVSLIFPGQLNPKTKRQFNPVIVIQGQSAQLMADAAILFPEILSRILGATRQLTPAREVIGGRTVFSVTWEGLRWFYAVIDSSILFGQDRASLVACCAAVAEKRQSLPFEAQSNTNAMGMIVVRPLSMVLTPPQFMANGSPRPVPALSPIPRWALSEDRPTITPEEWKTALGAIPPIVGLVQRRSNTYTLQSVVKPGPGGWSRLLENCIPMLEKVPMTGMNFVGPSDYGLIR